MTGIGRRWATWILLAAALSCFVLAKARVPELPPRSEPSGQWLPPPRLLGAVSAGFGGSLSSLVWIDAIMEYAGVVLDGKEQGGLVRDLLAVTALDTLWSHPYEFGGLALDDGIPAHVETATRLLETGVARFPDAWKIRLYLGMILQRDSRISPDSLARIFLPIATSRKAPDYARGLAFTIVHKGGRPAEAMSLLVRTYGELPDPMVRYQFRDKIMDLLRRNEVSLRDDAPAFRDAVGTLLESKDPAQERMARDLLIGMVDSTRREASLAAARQLAREYAAYSAKK